MALPLGWRSNAGSPRSSVMIRQSQLTLPIEGDKHNSSGTTERDLSVMNIHFFLSQSISLGWGLTEMSLKSIVVQKVCSSGLTNASENSSWVLQEFWLSLKAKSYPFIIKHAK